MSNEITLAELDAELLPERQTLWGFTFLSPVIFATNASQTIQAATLFSGASSVAVQNIWVG